MFICASIAFRISKRAEVMKRVESYGRDLRKP
jgi:hypothetical protein